MFIDGLGSGGAQRQFTRLARGLAARGHHVSVAVYNDQDHFANEIREAGIEIARLAKPFRWSFKPVIGLARLYRSMRADAVVAFLRSPAAKAELARILSGRMRVIAAERSVYPEGRLPLMLRTTEYLHRLAAFVTVNSRHQRLRMQGEFPALADRVVTIGNAIAVPREAATIRESLGRGPRLLALSSLMPKKNSVLLAKAVALLRDEHGIRVEVSWLGETFEHLGEYGAYRETCAVIADLGLESQWTWLGTRKDVNRVLETHDALIHASSVEGSSNAVCEAMAIGLPVIAGRIADHVELIEKPQAGLLFEAYDAKSIAGTIAEFAGLDGATRSAMGRAGRTIIERDFSSQRMISAYEKLLDAAIQGSKSPPLELAGPVEKRPCSA